MGGVDISDQMMEYYRISLKSRKWTTKVSQHFIDLAIVNSWMEYRADCEIQSIPKKNILRFLDFELEIGNSLIDAVPPKIQHDDSSSEEDELENNVKNLSKSSPLPSLAKRYDGFEHWMIKDFLVSSVRRCRLVGCTSRTRNKCSRCDVFLCSSKTKNCFQIFHKK